MAGASSSDGPGGSLRYFSGESEDPLEYKRWKTWAQNKLLTLDRLPKEAKGSYIYTLLSGKALECIEHLEASEYQKENGQALIWKLLDARFPQKEQTDILGETLSEIFSLRAKSGETLKTWVARATELFDRCERRVKVTFPSEARGWVLLHRSGLSDEQQAVVLARAQGKLDKERISVSMRSCYPDFVCRTGKTTAAHIIEDVNEDDAPGDVIPEVDFQDVELLLSEHQSDVPATGDSEVFLESEVAEVLAVTWKEKRAELSRLQKQRKFVAAKDMKRSFRIEVEELKRKTRCHRCGKMGHWSRECRQPRRDGAENSSKNSAGAKPSTGAAWVQAEPLDFVASVEPCDFVKPQQENLTLLQRARMLRTATEETPLQVPDSQEVLLVSSPGYGVLDSGCGRTIIGASTLRSFEQLLRQRQLPLPQRRPECNSFRFGNGATELSTEVAVIPVWLAGRRGAISAAIIQGEAPLLISRTALQTLKACLNFESNEKSRSPSH